LTAFASCRITPRSAQAARLLYAEWNNKAAGFVSYGTVGATRAVEQLRLIMAELQVADVRAQPALSLFTDFENFSAFTPGAHEEQAVTAMLNQLLTWGDALKNIRA
jgi:NAD(P)H-dependent FMN reductase